LALIVGLIFAVDLSSLRGYVWISLAIDVTATIYMELLRKKLFRKGD